MGGAGSYAALGARMLGVPEHPKLIGHVVHKGSDFPAELLQEINSWKTDCVFIETPERLTTRAWNQYGEDEYRGNDFQQLCGPNLWSANGFLDFKYVTPKLRVDYTHLPPGHLLSKCYHLICSPSRCIDLVKGIIEARKKLKEGNYMRELCEDLWEVLNTIEPPFFVWEPVPESCVPAEMVRFLEALKYVDVISPNHQELARLFGETGKDPFLASDLQILERQCNELLSKGFGMKPSAVVVRRGERGCYVATNTRHSWWPAYHKPYDELKAKERTTWTQKVVDPTGGGNAFLGGFSMGLIRDPNGGISQFEQAAHWGAVAASFVIEQVGMPKLTLAADGTELWNGESAISRWDKYIKPLLDPLRPMFNTGKEKSFYESVPSTILGQKETRQIRIPVDFEGKRQPPKH